MSVQKDVSQDKGMSYLVRVKIQSGCSSTSHRTHSCSTADCRDSCRSSIDWRRCQVLLAWLADTLRCHSTWWHTWREVLWRQLKEGETWRMWLSLDTPVKLKVLTIPQIVNGVKAAGAWSCPLPESTVEVKNMWRYASILTYILVFSL